MKVFPPSLSRCLWGRSFDSPIILAGGTAGFGAELLQTDGGCFEGVAAVVSKSVTLNPRAGNPPPRIQETEFGLLNSIGLANPGVYSVVKQVLENSVNMPCPLIMNVAGETEDEFARVVQVLEGSPVPWAYEVNVSCPNVACGGLPFGSDPGAVERISRTVAGVTARPFCVKLTPNAGSLVETAHAAQEGGASGVTVCNTFLGMKMNWKTGNTLLRKKVAGYSSPALLPLVVARVWQVSQAVSVPVLASGGVARGEDILELLAAGAEMVQVGSRLMRRPRAARELLQEARGLLE
ncbi:MAG: dihydroorotate dehydrogenase [Candidatus Fermentibacteraceae bacterium]